MKEVGAIAVQFEREIGCPAQLMIAQWPLESELGAEPVGHANYFGIKNAVRHTKSCIVTTHEFVNRKSVVENLEFADYDSLADSCREDAWLITRGAPHRESWQQYQQSIDLSALAASVARVYATDPPRGSVQTQLTDFSRPSFRLRAC